MSRARTLAGAIGSDGALNVADVAGLAAVASSGSASDLTTGSLPVARLPNAGSELGMRNRLINGAMDFWQRGTSFSGGGAYTADRWRYQRYASSSVTVSQQSSGLAAFPTCLRLQRPNGDTGTTSSWVSQALEASNSRPFRSNKATISFWARAGSGHQGLRKDGANGITASISYHTGSVEEYIVYNNYITQSSSISDFDVSLTTSWQYFTFTTSGAMPSNLTQIGVAFGVWSGYSGTAGANDFFEITGVQLEVGSTVTPFDYRLYGAELELCHRFCFRASRDTQQWVMFGLDSGRAQMPVYFPVTMRAVPSIGLVSQSPYWEIFPWTSAGTSMSGLTVSNGHMGVDGGEILLTATFDPSISRGISYTVRADNFIFSAEV